MRKDDYEIVERYIVSCYTYIEDDKSESLWYDSDDAYDYIGTNISDGRLLDEKKWWIIYPYKLKGSTITEDNMMEVVKWFVSESYDKSDIGLEWNFDNHCPIKDENDV